MVDQGLTYPGQTYQFTQVLDTSSNPVKTGDVACLLTNSNVRRADNGPAPAVIVNALAATTVNGPPAVVALSASSWAYVYIGGTTAIVYAVVCTISGGVITVGQAVAVSGTDGAFGVYAAPLSPGAFVVGYNDTTTGFPTVVACTVSGTTITAGTPVAVVSAAAAWFDIAALSATEIVAVYPNALQNPHAMVLTVSGTTIATNADTSIGIATSSSNGVVAALSSTLFALVYSGATNANAIACTVSGTTITAGAVANISSSATSSNTVITPLDATDFAVAWNDGAALAYTNVCSISGTTITSGTTKTISAVGCSVGGIAAASASTFAVTYGLNVGGVEITICTQSGGAITLGAPATVVNAAAANNTEPAVTAMDSTHFVVGFTGPTTLLPYALYEAFAGTTLTNPGVAVGNTVGVVVTPASPGQNVTIAGIGTVEGLTGLQTASKYWWDRTAGQLTTAAADDVVGLAFSSTTMLVKNFTGDQAFG